MTTTVLNRKISDVENKMPDASDLVTTTFFNRKIIEAENKIPSGNGLVKKTSYGAKIKYIEKKNSLLLIIINLQVAHLM